MTTLVRVLSTGRAGTKYIAKAFAHQGYQAYHEGLYAGEPTSAIIHYTRMLGDMWFHEREKYFAYESDFARPYIAKVLEIMESDEGQKTHSKRPKLISKLGGKQDTSMPGVIIDTGHRLTPATPLVEKEGTKAGLDIKYLILYRNPLRSIHGLYKVESQPGMMEGPYRNRPVSFGAEGGIVGAAGVWANTYQMAYEQMRHLGDDKFAFLDLERFNFDEAYIDNIFTFLDFSYDKKTFAEYAKTILEQPLRSKKSDSARNSHVFHDPDFSFSTEEVSQIYEKVADVIDVYGLDWQKIVSDYVRFHAKEKEGLGFDKQ